MTMRYFKLRPAHFVNILSGECQIQGRIYHRASWAWAQGLRFKGAYTRRDKNNRMKWKKISWTEWSSSSKQHSVYTKKISRPFQKGNFLRASRALSTLNRIVNSISKGAGSTKTSNIVIKMSKSTVPTGLSRLGAYILSWPTNTQIRPWSNSRWNGNPKTSNQFVSL